MKEILKIDNQMMAIIGEPAFYKLRVQVYEVNDSVAKVEKYIYNPKRYCGILLKIYLNVQLKKFKKMIEDNYYVIISNKEDYTYDDNYSFEDVFSGKYGEDVNVIITPAKETFDLFLEGDRNVKYISER